MHVFETREFARRASKLGLSDSALAEAVERAEQGAIDAHLGSGLIKQRVAAAGRGKSGGFRTVLAFRGEQRSVFLHVFAKNEQTSLSPRELDLYREAARIVLGLPDRDVAKAVAEGI